MKRRCGETVGGKDEEEIDLRALEPQDKTEQMWTGEGFGSRDVFDFNYLQLKSPPPPPRMCSSRQDRILLPEKKGDVWE